MRHAFLMKDYNSYVNLSDTSVEALAFHENGKIFECNLKFSDAFGYGQDEISGMSLFHFFPKIYREVVNCNLLGNAEQSFKTLGVRKDSSTFPAEVIVKLLTIQGRTLKALIIHDATETDKLENELLKTSAFQRAILDSSPFSIISTDFNGIIKTFNKGAEKIFKIKVEKVVNTTNIIDLHLSDELENRAKQLSAKLNKSIPPNFNTLVENLQQASVDVSEWTYVRSDSTKVIASVTVTPLKDHHDEITGYLFIGTDISDKKKAESEIIDKSQLLNGILQNMPVFIFKVNNAGVFTQSMGMGLLNLSLEKNQLTGLTIEQVFPASTKSVEKAFSGGFSSFINTSVVQGKEFHYEYSLFKDLTQKGGLIGFALDITAKIKAEIKLKDFAANLEKTNAQLNQFAHIVSHDLKAPLRAIANLSEWIEEGIKTPNEDVQRNMSLMKSRVRKMQNLIDGILNYSRADQVDSLLEEVDVDQLVKEVIHILDVPKKFTIHINNKLPILQYNNLLLEQIFCNLISNAIKYHDKPVGNITIDYKEQEEFYVFSVVDDGPGILPEYHEKIFIIFQTLQSKEKEESTGVGLAIVKKIVNERNGTVWVESDGVSGSTFSFTIPKK